MTRSISKFCKMPLWECSKELIAVAQGKAFADLVIQNAHLVNVNTHEIIENVDVAVACGRIAYVGVNGDAKHCIGSDTKVIDAQGFYLAPGFLDGHIHIESSMMGSGEYAKSVIPHGTVGIYFDPHEICNVLGLRGVNLMLEDAMRTPLKCMLTTPSCVPAVPGFEDTGSKIDELDIAESMEWQSTVGLGEMMNFVGVLNGQELPHNEIAQTLQYKKIVTGHYSSTDIDQGLNAYIASGVRCCHESTSPEEVLAKIRLGMYAQLRFGSAWQDLPVLAAIARDESLDLRFACLVSDDTHPYTIQNEGHMDRILRVAVQNGIDPITAIQMVTINTAQCFKMDDGLGSISPGKCADIVLLNNLYDFDVQMTLIDGEIVYDGHDVLFELESFNWPSWATDTINVGHEIDSKDFLIPVPDSYAESPKIKTRVIEVIGGKTLTKELLEDLNVKDGYVCTDSTRDILKAVVFERHHALGLKGCGFVKGFGIHGGAMASTVAHDAHNLLVVGDNDEDMALAAQTLQRCGGGLAVVSDREVLGLVDLPIAGIMNDKNVSEMAQMVSSVQHAWKRIGCTLPSPFMTMSLIPLACIPELRLTNRGLVNCSKFEFVDLFVHAPEVWLNK